jgi:hypothetical protein
MRWVAARKLRASLSYLVAMRRPSLMRQKKFSIFCRRPWSHKAIMVSTGSGKICGFGSEGPPRGAGYRFVGSRIGDNCFSTC